MQEQTLLAKINDAHYWRIGDLRWPAYGGLEQTDTCRVCGMRRQWRDDRKNGPIDAYRFWGPTGGEMTIWHAARRECVRDHLSE